MMAKMVAGALLLTALLAPAARAAEPVKRIDIHVQPYYQAAKKPDGRPQVAVGASLSGPLSSDRREDIVAVRDKIAADPKLITPMTLMVLAIRLYDVGLRDDAVFWFYAAKDRYITLSDVVDVGASGLAEVEAAMRAFATLAGPVINSYAFCDLAKQKALRQQALAWVEQNSYGAIFLDRMVAKPGDRADNLKASVRAARLRADKEQAYLDDAKNREAFYARRKQNGVEAQFCWK